MLSTLQRYVARELLKTFALTAVGLTLTFSLCGGVLNMIQAEVLTAVQMARILMFILPVSLTLTLPVAALFACAMVYGRLASDNEIDACRASGINIYRLLWPAFALSVFTAGFTFSFTNYILPTFIVRLDALVRKDLEKIVVSALNTRGYIRRGPYVLYARHAAMPDDTSDSKLVDIRKAAFLELEHDTLRSCGTADQVRIEFKAGANGGNPTVQAYMRGVRGLDLKREQFYEESVQPIQSVEIPSTVKEHLKWLTLPQLLRYQSDLARIPSVQMQLDGMRLLVREAAFYRYVVGQLQAGSRMVRLQDNRVQYELRAEQATQDERDMRPELLQVSVKQVLGGRRREYKADRCILRLKPGFAGGPETCQLLLRGNVKFVDSRDPRNAIERDKDELDEVAISADLLPANTTLTDRQILGLPDAGTALNVKALVQEEPEHLNLGGRIEDARVKTRKDVAQQSLEIAGIVHSRLAFSVSTLVMLVLAAALAIIFRGGQMLTAFVISFLPGMLVVVLNIMGRQLAENFGTQLVGLSIIWAGIVLLGIADLVVLGRYLRR